MKDMDYVFAVARIRVKEKYLLSDADVRQMTGMPDEKAVMAFLTEKGWGDDTDHLQNADDLLETEQTKTWNLMKELKIEQEIFDILSYPKLFHNLKTAVKDICTSEEHVGSYYEHDRYSGEKLKRILRDKDYSALPVSMREAARRAYEVMLQTQDSQKCDIIVDRACLDAMAKEGRNASSPLMRDYEESQVAMADIRIAARAQATGKSAAFLKEALAECRSIDARGLADAAARGRDALLDYLESHGMAEAAEALSQSPSAFERWCDNQLIRTLRSQKYNTASVGPIIAYYLARENEIKTVRIILTGKANGFSEEEIRERVREMYV